MPRGHTWMTRVHTWLTRGMPRGRPDPDPSMTQPDPAYQPPLTAGPVVVNGGLAVVNDGPSPTTDVAATIDCRSPPYCTGGGWTNERVTRVIRGTVAGFVNSSKILEKEENKSDKGYHEVPSPFTGNYMPPKRDIRLIDKHFESASVDVSTISSSDGKTVDVKGMVSKEEPNPVRMNNFSPPIIEDWVSESEEEDEPKIQKQV
nr:hypothetical protein [Tanacetum cinerariifolium]